MISTEQQSSHVSNIHTTVALGHSPQGNRHVCHMCAAKQQLLRDMFGAIAHKNGRLEEERVTPIEAHSPVIIIEPY